MHALPLLRFDPWCPLWREKPLAVAVCDLHPGAPWRWHEFQFGWATQLPEEPQESTTVHDGDTLVAALTREILPGPRDSA